MIIKTIVFHYKEQMSYHYDCNKKNIRVSLQFDTLTQYMNTAVHLY